MTTTLSTRTTRTTVTTGASSASTYDLEGGAFAGMPSLVGTAMGPARSFFSGALEWVCGEPDTLIAAGQKYLALGARVGELSGSLASAGDALPQWQGPAATRFRATVAEAVDVVGAVGGFVGHTDQILRAAADVAVKAADAIWDLVTELVRWLCTTLAKALATSAMSMGGSIAAWMSAAVAQVGKVVAVVTKLCGTVGQVLSTIMNLLRKLAALIERYRGLLDSLQQVLSGVQAFPTTYGDLSDAAGGGGALTWAAYRDADPTERARLTAPTSSVPSLGSVPAPGAPGYVAPPRIGVEAGLHGGVDPLAGVTPVTPGAPTGTGYRPDSSWLTPQPVGTDGTRSAGVTPGQPTVPTASAGTRPEGPAAYRPEVPSGYRPEVPTAGTGAAGVGSTGRPGSAPSYGSPSSGVGSPGVGSVGSIGVGSVGSVPATPLRPGALDVGMPSGPTGAGPTGAAPRPGSLGAVDPAMAPLMPLGGAGRSSGTGSSVPLDGERSEAWSESATDAEAELALGTRAAGATPAAPPLPTAGALGAGSLPSGLPTALPVTGAMPAPSAGLPAGAPTVAGDLGMRPTTAGASAGVPGTPMAPAPLPGAGRRDDRGPAGPCRTVSDRTTELIELDEAERAAERRDG